MNTMRLLAISMAIGTLQAPADAPATRCFDGDTGQTFPTSETIAFGTALESKIPEVKIDSDGHPTKLIWVPRSENTSVEVEQIGRYRDKGIYRVVYRQSTGNAGVPASKQVCVMFGFQNSAPEGMGIRPFFVVADDQIWPIKSYFTSSKDHPFALEIHKTFKGNGVFCNSYTFLFSPTEARIVERSEGGRKMHTKTYRYDKLGKVVTTQTSTEE